MIRIYKQYSVILCILYFWHRWHCSRQIILQLASFLIVILFGGTTLDDKVLVHSGFIVVVALIPLWQFFFFLLTFLLTFPGSNSPPIRMPALWGRELCISFPAYLPWVEQSLAYNTCQVSEEKSWDLGFLSSEWRVDVILKRERSQHWELLPFPMGRRKEAGERQCGNPKEARASPGSKGRRSLEEQEECWVEQLKRIRPEEGYLDSMMK